MTPARFVTSGDVQLALYTWGTPDGRPLVLLLHGYPDCAHAWTAVAERLAEDHYVVAYDVRGAGQSTRPEHTEDYALPHLARDMEAVLDAIAPVGSGTRVHLVAHDWGSIQSWEFVCTPHLERRFASFTSMSGPCLDHVGYWVRDRLSGGSPRDLSLVAAQLSRSWYIGLFQLPGVAPALMRLSGDKAQERLAAREGLLHVAPSPTFADDARYGINLYRANVPARLRQPSVRRTGLPVHLVWARDDHYMIPELWDSLTEWAPDVYRSELESPHWLQLTRPDEVARRVRLFVRHIESLAGRGEGATGEPAPSPYIERAKRLGRAGRSPRGTQRGKLAVITGAGSGFGRETALLFAREGADVVAVDIDAASAADTAARCQALGRSAWSRTVDVGDPVAMRALATWVKDALCVPEVVVNNAGIGLAGSFFDTSNADWERILRINLGGVILGSRLFGKQMVDAGQRGHLVNVASMAAYTPSRGMAAYATSKAAVRMLSDCLRAELADTGVHVSTICPGMSITNITRTTTFVGLDAEAQAAQQARATRFYEKRNLQPETIAETILACVEDGRDEAPVGAEAHVTRWLSRVSPGALRRLARVELSA
ncbi:MAG: SDR family oxidoreductase [Sandaracinaceae bacterium]|nr:SDR family oxidoreductase [Sandaracinaceae bacterium]